MDIDLTPAIEDAWLATAGENPAGDGYVRRVIAAAVPTIEAAIREQIGSDLQFTSNLVRVKGSTERDASRDEFNKVAAIYQDVADLIRDGAL